MTFSEVAEKVWNISHQITSCDIPCNVESIELLTDPLRVEVKIKEG